MDVETTKQISTMRTSVDENCYAEKYSRGRELGTLTGTGKRGAKQVYPLPITSKAREGHSDSPGE